MILRLSSVEQELQGDHSDNETLASNMIPALPLDLGSHASPTPVNTPGILTCRFSIRCSKRNIGRYEL